MMSTRNDNLQRSQKVAEKAIWLEGALVVSKIVAGSLSQSYVLISDAIHSASDILTIVTSWAGLKIAQKKPDEKFAYGYYKAENLGTFIISLIIIYAGWKMLSQGYSSLTNPSTVNLPLVALAVSLVDAVVLFFFGNYEIKVGQQTNTESLIAMGKENRTHLFSSLAVFVGTLAAFYQLPYVEGVITMGISVLIFEIGLTSLKNAVLALMDVSPSQDLAQKVKQAAENVPGVEEAFDLKLRKSGPSVMGELKIGIRKNLDVNRSHQLAHKVKQAIKNKIEEIDSFSVHVEPFKTDYRHLVFPVNNKQGLESKLAPKLARSKYLLFVNLKGTEIKGHYFLKNPYLKKQKRAGLALAKMIASKKSDTIITHQIGEIAFHAFREYLFDIYQTPIESVNQLIEKYLAGKLKQLAQPTTEGQN